MALFDFVEPTTKRQLIGWRSFFVNNPAKYYIRVWIDRGFPSNLRAGMGVKIVAPLGTEFEGLTGDWKIKTKSSTYIDITSTSRLVISGPNRLNIPLGMPVLALLTTSEGSNDATSYPETVALSAVRYNNSLGASGVRCALQNRVFTFLNSLWGIPAMKSAFTTSFEVSKMNPSVMPFHGYAGPYSKTRIVNAFMCTVRATSSSNDGLTGCWDKDKVTIATNEDFTRYGLWQLYRAQADQEISYFDDGFVPDWWDSSRMLEPEYNTRGAAWLMYAAMRNFQSPYIAWPQTSSWSPDPVYSDCMNGNRFGTCC